MNYVMTIINNVLGAFWVVIFVGVVHIISREWRPIFGILRGELKGKQAQPALLALRKRLIRRTLYLLGGGLLVLMAWSLVIWLMNTLVGNVEFSDSVVTAGSPFNVFRRMSGDIAALGVIGFISSGICFALSAGEPWLVRMGKIFFSLTVVAIAYLLVFAALG